MPHKFIDAKEVPGRTYTRSRLIQDAVIKIADAVSPGKAVLIDCDKLDRKPASVIAVARKLIKNGELPGVTVQVRDKNTSVYLVRA